jgi:hypothetical protein
MLKVFWKRFSLTARLVSILILLLIVGVIVYQLYAFYQDKIGFTPTKAIEDYFNALAKGNDEEVYRLTAKKDLTDLYGRPITKGEFLNQLQKVRGSHPLPLTRVEATKIAERQGVRYYLVKIYASVGGTTTSSRVVVEVRREDKSWVVSYPFAIVLQ